MTAIGNLSRLLIPLQDHFDPKGTFVQEKQVMVQQTSFIFIVQQLLELLEESPLIIIAKLCTLNPPQGLEQREILVEESSSNAAESGVQGKKLCMTYVKKMK
jgi:hypothetical protein